MTTSSTASEPRPRWGSRRRAARLVLGAASLALLAVPAVGSSVSAGAAPYAGDRSDCVGAPAAARVDPRAASLAEDPTATTPAQAARMQADLQRRARVMAQKGLLTRQGDVKRRPRLIKIGTYVHVITRTDGTGGVTPAQIKAQMKVLNNSYAGTTSPVAAKSRLRFVLKSVDVTARDDWYNWSQGSTDGAAKPALHKGGYRNLNIYIAGLQGGLLGYATFPGGPLALDGLVLLNESLPGGSAAPFNLGDTAPHEVGHWLGLFHTFQDGCTYPGDYIEDTPYQLDGANIFSCDATLDTCPAPGRDPVRNFMNYSDDACMNRFTRAQQARQTLVWYVYRAWH